MGAILFCDRRALVLGGARTIPSKFSMPASYFRAPITMKIEWGGRAMPLQISIFGRSGIPNKIESKTVILGGPRALLLAARASTCASRSKGLLM